MSKKTKEMIIVAAIILMMVLMSIAKTNLSNLSLVPSSNAVVFTIISLNVVLLILVVFLVIRNVVKLMLERRRGVLGTRLRTKLVVAFVTLTIIPTTVLFFASVVFLNRSMEGWLSNEVEDAIEESMNVANIYYQEASADAIHYASSISKEITEGRLLKEENLNILKAMLQEKMDLFRLSSVVVFSAHEKNWRRSSHRTSGPRPCRPLNPVPSDPPCRARACPWWCEKARQTLLKDSCPSDHHLTRPIL